ncbi:hypothetical protein E2C01_026145 [Portunus trituberculatus]|uniref:Uncharacterized protein n=1 Tax=Portunus trituberculatus TaxID=210409 RepID=A0A5B7EHE3_PORTR|nr:hypothetical protein [Portunus trituberculatus]
MVVREALFAAHSSQVARFDVSMAVRHVVDNIREPDATGNPCLAKIDSTVAPHRVGIMPAERRYFLRSLSRPLCCGGRSRLGKTGVTSEVLTSAASLSRLTATWIRVESRKNKTRAKGRKGMPVP